MNVDIIMPAHNPGTYIVEAIESCLNQSYKKIKITVIDDGSTENLSYLKTKYPINLLRTNGNAGPSAARNLGLRSTVGDLISFLDADDIMHRDKIYLSVREFEKQPDLGLVCGNYQIIVNRHKVLKPFYKRAPTINWQTLMNKNLVASGSTTISRQVVEKIGLFDERFWIGEDADYWLRISEVYPIQYLHKVLYYYSVCPGNNSLTQRSDIQKQHLANLEIMRLASKERMKYKNANSSP